MKLILSILTLVFISACVQQSVTEVTIPGHPVYTFSNDIRESLAVRTNNADGIRQLILNSKNITVIFNGSSEKDNGLFQVVAFNTITKLQTYFVWEGRVLGVDSYYFIDDRWYGKINDTTVQISMPAFSGSVVWLKGPSTGANETSLTLYNNIIAVQGTSYEGLTTAGDKLVLIVLGIEKI